MTPAAIERLLLDDVGDPLALLAPATTELADYPHMIDLLVGALASLDGVAPAAVRSELARIGSAS